jgi:hypothetical protein
MNTNTETDNTKAIKRANLDLIPQERVNNSLSLVLNLVIVPRERAKAPINRKKSVHTILNVKD